MTLSIPDDLLREAKLTESELLLEVACRLFETGRISLHSARKIANISRQDFEAALLERKIPIYQVTVEDLHRDLDALKAAGV